MFISIYNKKLRSSAREPISKTEELGKEIGGCGGRGEGWMTRLPFPSQFTSSCRLFFCSDSSIGWGVSYKQGRVVFMASYCLHAYYSNRDWSATMSSKKGARVSWSGRPPTPSMCRFDKPFATFEEHSRSLEISGRRQKFYKVQTVASIKRRCWFFPLVIIQDQTSVIWPLLVRWLTKTLGHTFITSKVDYCNSLLYGRPKYLLQRLEHFVAWSWSLTNLWEIGL